MHHAQIFIALLIEPLNLPKLNLEVVYPENFTIFHSYFPVYVSFFYSIKGIVNSFLKTNLGHIFISKTKKEF